MPIATHRIVLLPLSLVMAVPAAAQSVFTTRIDDPAAVYLTAEAFGVRGDGAADDSGPLQAAIDKAATSPTGGILFVPSGRYRITRTLLVWRGVRVFGYGATRPVIALGANTPGYQKGIGLMVMFTNAGRPGAGPPPGNTRVPFPPPGMVPPRDDIPDASPVTFYPAMSNVDVDVGDGNPAAVAIRFHVAQHGYLSHMNFRIGSGLAALMQIGNQADDVHIFGGRYGILTENTSPYWPFTLIDSTFEGQREAAIREHMAGMTLVRVSFTRVPVAIEIDKEYADQLWVKDSRFEDISNAAVLISSEKNGLMQAGVENAVCRNVPVFARFRESARTLNGPGPIYRVADFNHGIFVTGTNTVGHIDTRFTAAPLAALPAPLPPAIAPLPPTTDWVNVRTLGVAGTGKVDDTEAIKKAVASHRVLYFPSGYYIVRDTIALKPDTVIVALHPGTAQLDVPDASPAFDGVGPPTAVLQTPKGGTNIVSGIGIYTGATNSRATGILWMAGGQSLLNDIQFHGGAGTFLPQDVRTAFYTPPAPAGGRGGGPPAPAGGRLGAKYPSLWVTNGGGGTFVDIWSPDSQAQGGFYVSDTTTPGHVYEVSVEHHLFNEIKLDRVENWDFNGPQTEEEAGSSPEAVALEINASRNITIANYHGYRVTRTHAPFPAAVRVTNSTGIRFRNVHVKSESGYPVCDENGCGTFLRAGKFAYENSIQDVTRGREVREREFAFMDLPSAAGAPESPKDASAVADGAVEKVEGGFYAISGAAAGADGTLYFVDRHQHRIFSWSKARGLEVIRHDPFDPVNLAVDRSGHVLVQSSAGRDGTVYSFTPGGPTDEMTVLQPQAAAPSQGAMVALPGNVWINGEFNDQIDLDTLDYKTVAQMFIDEMRSPEAKQYVSPDGSLFLPAGRVFRQPANEAYPGMDATGWRWSHNLNAMGFVTALPGRRVYISNGAENVTYRGTVQPDGTLADVEPFAERGGESVVEDGAGNVYVANGQIFVYDREGTLRGRIDVPERPVQLVFGGPDRRTLFILAHHTLYAVRTKAPGATLR